jgi:Tol biopolymer transport system component/tRNA A-37 threonylcarbamoyl transferase component Bud32
MTSSPETLSRLSNALEGRYRIERELGQGGMATVYLAQDVRHDRRVAIKVLHADLSAVIGGDRFLAEIKTTAALQHPHILPLFDSGSADGLLFYVMPLVEGDTLRDRLNKDKQLAIPEALRIATEVAGALDYAHRQNVVHRDIKPENILLQDGSAVVADFGIALAVHHAGEQRMTQTGLSLGTPQYMSPEQAMGEKNVDKRADVYALGAVLYELLTGEPPFSGASVQAIVAKVLTERPPRPSTVRDTIPPHVEAAILTALAKLPADRFATAAQFADALARPEATASYATMTGAPTAAMPPRNRAMQALPWGIAAVAAAATAWLALKPTAPAPMGPIVLAEMPSVGGSIPALVGTVRPIVISPDGSKIAYLGIDSTRVPRLLVQSLNSETIWPVPESQFGGSPAFSEDGNTLVFTLNGEIRVIGVGESRPRAIYRSTVPAPWNASGFVFEGDSTIVFAERRGLYRIRASGGQPQLIAPPPRDSGARYAAPVPIGDGRSFLATLANVRNPTAPVVVALRQGDSVPTDLALTGARPQLVNDTLLLTFRDGAVRASVFDPKALRVKGEPTVISGAANLQNLTAFAASRNGVVTFIVGAPTIDAELTIVDRSGQARAALPQRQAYRFPRFSPDGNRIAFGVTGVNGPSSGDVWVLDTRDAKTMRVTSDGLSYHPEWTADGQSIRHLHRDSTYQGTVFVSRADGTSPATPLFTALNGNWEHILASGNRLLLRRDNSGTGRDVYMVELDGGKTTPLLNSQFDEKGIALSPDGTWFAYGSDEAGTPDVYIRRVDPGAPRSRVSVGGGSEPRWTKTGEIFFRRGDSLMVSRVKTASEPPAISAPELVLRGDYAASTFEALYDVSPDARRFVFVRMAGGSRLRIAVLVNWQRLLAPAARR